jgi:hypothetical protein
MHMAFDAVVEVPSQIEVYNERWQRLLDHVHAGIPLHEQVREAIEAWGRQATPEGKVETDPDKRFEQVKARVAALSTHFTEVIGVVTVWAAGLKPLMDAAGASLDGLPLFSAVDEIHSAFARAENRRLPEKPSLDLNDPASLERRARWLRDVAEIMGRVEGGPRDIGAALRSLEAVLLRLNDELESARGRGRKGNVSALRWLPPLHPALGAVPVSKPPAQPKDELAFMYR